MKTSQNEVVKTPAGGVPALAGEFEHDQGSGLEGSRPEESKPAFLYLLQTTSKAVNRGSEEYVEGAAAGLFFSTGSRRLWEAVDFFAVRRETAYIEWIPVEEGGGFIDSHEPGSEFVRRYIRSDKDRFKDIRTEDGHQLVQTQTIYGLIGPPGFTAPEEAELAAIPFTSIKIRHYVNWFDAVKRLTYQVGDKIIHPDIWRHRWRLTAQFEQKWKPNGAWNVRVGLAAPSKEEALVRTSDPLYPVLKELHERASDIRADYSRERQPGEDNVDDEIPM